MGGIPIHTTTCFLDVVSGDLKKDYKDWVIPYLLLEDLFSPSIASPKINLEVTHISSAILLRLSGVTSWNSVTISSSFTQWTALRLLLVFIDCKKKIAMKQIKCLEQSCIGLCMFFFNFSKLNSKGWDWQNLGEPESAINNL